MRCASLIPVVLSGVVPSISSFARTPSFTSKRISSLCSTANDCVEVTVETKPIPGMKPGTSGLRKKVEVWQGTTSDTKNYVENFVQSLMNVAVKKNGGKMLDTYV
jgi:hypothetical protein